MKMAWIESHTVLLRHRKLIILASALGIKPVTAMGHLHALWHAALEQQEDGDLSRWSTPMIAQIAAYEGDPDRFVQALNACRWLDGRLLHDWLDYAGPYLARKYHNSGRRYLQEIWKTHGRTYGKHYRNSTSLRKRQGSESTSSSILSPLIEGSLLSKKGDSKGGTPERVTRILGADFLLPDWLPKAEWEEYLAHRKRKRATVTESIAKRIIAVLRELMELGHSPAAVLAEAIDRNWTGLKVDWIHKDKDKKQPFLKESDQHNIEEFLNHGKV